MPVANEKPYSFLRHAAMLVPAAGVFLSNALSVKTSSLLLAISAMDPAIIGKARATDFFSFLSYSFALPRYRSFNVYTVRI